MDELQSHLRREPPPRDDVGAGRRLARQLASYRLVRLSTVGRLRAAGFQLLPTFARPHFTVVLPGVESTETRLANRR